MGLMYKWCANSSYDKSKIKMPEYTAPKLEISVSNPSGL